MKESNQISARLALVLLFFIGGCTSTSNSFSVNDVAVNYPSIHAAIETEFKDHIVKFDKGDDVLRIETLILGTPENMVQAKRVGQRHCAQQGGVLAKHHKTTNRYRYNICSLELGGLPLFFIKTYYYWDEETGRYNIGLHSFGERAALAAFKSDVTNVNNTEALWGGVVTFKENTKLTTFNFTSAHVTTDEYSLINIYASTSSYLEFDIHSGQINKTRRININEIASLTNNEDTWEIITQSGETYIGKYISVYGATLRGGKVQADKTIYTEAKKLFLFATNGELRIVDLKDIVSLVPAGMMSRDLSQGYISNIQKLDKVYKPFAKNHYSLNSSSLVETDRKAYVESISNAGTLRQGSIFYLNWPSSEIRNEAQKSLSYNNIKSIELLSKLQSGEEVIGSAIFTSPNTSSKEPKTVSDISAIAISFDSVYVLFEDGKFVKSSPNTLFNSLIDNKNHDVSFLNYMHERYLLIKTEGGQKLLHSLDHNSPINLSFYSSTSSISLNQQKRFIDDAFKGDFEQFKSTIRSNIEAKNK